MSRDPVIAGKAQNSQGYGRGVGRPEVTGSSRDSKADSQAGVEGWVAKQADPRMRGDKQLSKQQFIAPMGRLDSRIHHYKLCRMYLRMVWTHNGCRFSNCENLSNQLHEI